MSRIIKESQETTTGFLDSYMLYYIRNKMNRTRIVDVLKDTEYGKDVCVKGWVRTHRSSKAVDFIALSTTDPQSKTYRWSLMLVLWMRKL